MDAKVASWIQDIQAPTLEQVAARMGVAVADILGDEGLAAEAFGHHFDIEEERTGGPSADPSYASYIASQGINPSGA